MAPRYAKSYVDRLYADRDIGQLHGLIEVVSRNRSLPKQFWLFLRLVEWAGSTRSGVWQYYEGLSSDKFESIAALAERFGLKEVAIKYRFGMSTWQDPEPCKELDDWIDSHRDELEMVFMRLIENDRDHLCG